jgi:hypothetical protein
MTASQEELDARGEEIDNLLRHVINCAVSYEVAKGALSDVEDARLKLALADPSEDVQALIDECMDVMCAQLAEVTAALLNEVALEPGDE